MNTAKRIESWPLWEVFFPQPVNTHEDLSLIKKTGLLIMVSGLASLLGFFLKPGGMIGFDWLHFWSTGINPPHYPPWNSWLLPFLNWNLMVGITIGGFTVLVISRFKHLPSAIASFFCLPFLWILLLGQIDGIATAGLVALPLTIPIALIKPQVTLFAMFSKRSIFIYTALFLLLSFAVFGFWPTSMMNVESVQTVHRAEQNIGLGGWWTVLALIGLWFSRGDMDMMMLAGTVALPYFNSLSPFPHGSRGGPFKAVGSHRCDAFFLAAAVCQLDRPGRLVAGVGLRGLGVG